MRQVWLAMGVALFAVVVASVAEAQRFPQVMNMNTHEGKYSTGGVGLSIGGGFSAGGNFRRERLGSKSIDGGLEAVFKKDEAQNQSRTIFGAQIDFQIGSDNSVIGTDFGVEFYNFQLGTSATNDVDFDAVEGLEKSATLLYIGFDFTIELYSSEFIETDGRRTRQNWGLSVIVGPKVGMLFGDFGDINGFSSIGLDYGIMADFPINIPGAEDLLSISPYIFMETNFRMDVDGGLIDTNPASPTAGQDILNDNFDTGFYNDSQQDLDNNGVADSPGIAVRRHDFIPAFQLNTGVDVNLTPIFVSRDGSLINSWRFHVSLMASIPVQVNFFLADYNGAALWGTDEIPMTLTMSFGASYFW